MKRMISVYIAIITKYKSRKDFKMSEPIENMPITQHFRKEKVILIESIRKLNFISHIPASPQIPPASLYHELQKFPMAIDFNRYFAVQSMLDCLNIIFKYELADSCKIYSETKSTIKGVINELEIFPEIYAVINKYENEVDINTFLFKDVDFSNVAKILFLSSYEKLSNKNYIFDKETKLNDIHRLINQGNFEYEKKVSSDKIVVLYSLVTIVDIVFDVSLSGKATTEAIESFDMTSELLDKLNFL